MQKLISTILSLVCLAYQSVAYAELDDPMRPISVNSKKAAAPGKIADIQNNKWYLHSILISDHRKVAIINGRPVSIGDQVDGARVTHIDKESVQLTGLNQHIRLHMHALAIKKKPRE